MKPFAWWVRGLVWVVFLSGCSGSGGGSGVSRDTFEKWSAINPPATVRVNGMSQDATYTSNPEPPPVVLVDDQGVSTNSSATITYRADGTIERIDVSTPYIALSWNEAGGDIVEEGSEWLFAIDKTQSEFTAGSNPGHPSVGWDYQTYGAWETGRIYDSGTLGAITIGAPTLASAIPKTDEVTFKGYASGIFIDAAGDDYFAYSTLTVGVDFLNRFIDFKTAGTMKIPVDNLLTGIPTALPTAYPELNLAGNFFYAADKNAFSGELATSDALGLSGLTSGRFYGPHAEELGGIFSLSVADDPASSLHYYGGYGAAR